MTTYLAWTKPGAVDIRIVDSPSLQHAIAVTARRNPRAEHLHVIAAADAAAVVAAYREIGWEWAADVIASTHGVLDAERITHRREQLLKEARREDARADAVIASGHRDPAAALERVTEHRRCAERLREQAAHVDRERA